MSNKKDSPERELIGLYFSPWTERARWALDYHGVSYQYSEFTTILDEFRVRFKTGKPFQKVTAPVLVMPDQNLNDSFLIAKFADSISDKDPLVPAAHLAEIEHWINATELALCSARIRATRRIKKSTDALADRLPEYIPDFLRKPFIPVAYLGSSVILWKYRLDDDTEESLHRNLDAFLSKADTALKNRQFVFDKLSFADLVIATMLQAIRPVSAKYIKLNDASLNVMNEQDLAEKYSGLIDWRDRLYDAYR